MGGRVSKVLGSWRKRRKCCNISLCSTAEKLKNICRLQQKGWDPGIMGMEAKLTPLTVLPLK